MTVIESLSTEDAAFVREIVAVNEGRAALYRVLAHYYFKELTIEEIEKVASRISQGWTVERRLSPKASQT